MNAVLGRHLTILDPGPYRRRLIRMAVFRRRGRLPPGEKRLVLAFDQTPRRVVLPRGLVRAASRIVPLRVVDRRLTLAPVDFRWRGTLYPYQVSAARAVIKNEGGVLVAPPGAGKTVMGLAAAAAWRQPTLWLVHTLELQQQALERAHALYGLPDGAYATIGEGARPEGLEGRALYVAMIQTMAQVAGWTEWMATRVGTVIVDECHHTPASTYRLVIGQMPARFRLGLSATPQRTDGLGPLMRAVLGPQVQVPLRLLVDVGRIVLPTIRLVETDFRLEDDALAWDAMEKARAEDPGRNRIVLSLAFRAYRAHRKVMILVARKQHARMLAAALERAGVPAAAITGDATTERRNRAFERLERGRMVVVATRVANEGLDLPLLDTLILASAARSPVTLEQQLGRLMRTARGKGTPVAFDVIDSHVPALAEQARARRQYYAEVGYQVARYGWR